MSKKCLLCSHFVRKGKGAIPPVRFQGVRHHLLDMQVMLHDSGFSPYGILPFLTEMTKPKLREHSMRQRTRLNLWTGAACGPGERSPPWHKKRCFPQELKSIRNIFVYTND